MKEFLVHGLVAKVDTRTSKQGTTYSIIQIEDKEGIVEVVAGSKVEVPTVGSNVLCRGSIRSTPRNYQNRVFYSYSFYTSSIEVIYKIADGDKELDVKFPRVGLNEINDFVGTRGPIVYTDHIDIGDEKIPF